jgi:hypothetical protein
VIKEKLLIKIKELMDFYSTNIKDINYGISFEVCYKHISRVTIIGNRVLYRGRSQSFFSDISSLTFNTIDEYERNLKNLYELDYNMLASIYKALHGFIEYEISSMLPIERKHYDSLNVSVPVLHDIQCVDTTTHAKKIEYKNYLVAMIMASWPQDTPNSVDFDIFDGRNTLVISHGFYKIRGYTNINKVLLRENFVVLYPRGFHDKEIEVKYEDENCIDDVIKILDGIAMEIAKTVRINKAAAAIHDEDVNYVQSAMTRYIKAQPFTMEHM